MKIREYLIEGIDSKTRRFILQSIDHFPKGSSKMGDIEVKGDGKSVKFIYPQKNFDLTQTLVDIVDSIPSRSFDYSDKSGKITFIVKGM